MQKNLIKLVAFFLLVWFFFRDETPKKNLEMDRRETIKRVELSTVAFVKPDAENEGEFVPYCAGVWTARNKMLTAKHCLSMSVEVDGKKLVAYRSKRSADETRLATVIAEDEKEDLALLLSIDATGEHPIAGVSTGVWTGEKLHVVGHTMGLWWSYVEGTVSAEETQVKTYELGNVNMLQVSSAAWFGNSGGGAFDEEGRLVGICSWVSSKAPHLTFFVRPTSIKNFLLNNESL